MKKIVSRVFTYIDEHGLKSFALREVVIQGDKEYIKQLEHDLITCNSLDEFERISCEIKEMVNE